MTAGERRSFLVLLALAAVLFFFKVGMPLTDGDTAYYGKIARNILATGDWLTLHYRGDDFVDKPPLSIWPMALSYRLFGFHDWATRGWHSLLAVGSVLLTYAIGRRLYSPKEAFWGGVVFATSFLMAYMGQVPQQDVPLLFFSLLSFWALLRWVAEGRLADWLLAGASTGLAVLTRGLQGVVLPVGVVALYLGLRLLLPGATREGARLPSLPAFLAGFAAFLLTAVPWYYLEYRLLGPSFLNYFFGAGNVRYLKDIAPASPGGPLAYVPLLILAVLPWAGLLVSALKLGVQEALTRRQQREGWAALFLLSWFLVAFFLPLTIRWRVIRYLLPSLPPLALLTGRFLHLLLSRDETGEESRRRRLTEYRRISWFTLAAGLLLVAGVLSTVPRFPQAQQGLVPVLLPFLAVFLCALIASAAAGLLRRPLASVVLLAGGAFLAYLIVFTQLERHIYLVNPWPAAARTVNDLARPGDRVLLVNETHNPFVEYYVLPPVQTVTPAELSRILDERAARPALPEERLLLLAEGKALTALVQNQPAARRPRELHTFPGGTAVAVW
ncbi:MAG: glycosyltransferase family 39 protein [Bacillota bacterium]|nr:glycosyltransferase family 39 protein [Bacillota bacterium]